jgi:general stress protein YciG
MPKGPKGEKRPADVIANAVSMGKRGGKARAQNMTPERRAEIAKKAAAKRWQG